MCSRTLSGTVLSAPTGSLLRLRGGAMTKHQRLRFHRETAELLRAARKDWLCQSCRGDSIDRGTALLRVGTPALCRNRGIPSPAVSAVALNLILVPQNVLETHDERNKLEVPCFRKRDQGPGTSFTVLVDETDDECVSLNEWYGNGVFVSREGLIVLECLALVISSVSRKWQSDLNIRTQRVRRDWSARTVLANVRSAKKACSFELSTVFERGCSWSHSFKFLRLS